MKLSYFLWAAALLTAVAATLVAVPLPTSVCLTQFSSAEACGAANGTEVPTCVRVGHCTLLSANTSAVILPNSTETKLEVSVFTNSSACEAKPSSHLSLERGKCADTQSDWTVAWGERVRAFMLSGVSRPVSCLFLQWKKQQNRYFFFSLIITSVAWHRHGGQRETP